MSVHEVLFFKASFIFQSPVSYILGCRMVVRFLFDNNLSHILEELHALGFLAFRACMNVTS